MAIKPLLHQLQKLMNRPVAIEPLAGFRILFGAAMVFSTLRFMANGWVANHFIDPQVFFHYPGFAWVQPLPAPYMYFLHGVLVLASLLVMLGLLYRWAATLQFLLFSYFFLIDLTHYLNHYYFICLVCFWLIWVPANRRYSLDVRWRLAPFQEKIPLWALWLFRGQLMLVYFFAGLAKINPDWLLRAQPLRTWLPAHQHLPLIGSLLGKTWAAYAFSWAGMLYDSTVGFLLCDRRFRWLAYAAVVVFHSITGVLFQIGVFPQVMILATLVFFSPEFHRRWLRYFDAKPTANPHYRPTGRAALVGIGLYFLLQILIPLRSYLYPGNMFWTEDGYRFGWRVMLMEKAATAHFFVRDGKGREVVVNNSRHLLPHQEKQMAMQPDMILQYADYLENHFRQKGFHDPKIRAEVHVTLNGRRGQLYFDPQLDLTKIEPTSGPRIWLNPYPYRSS